MKAHVFVTLKRTVLDAQGQTIANALHRMNFRGVAELRQGKYFLLTLDPAAFSTQQAASAEVDRIAREVLVNPVIEEYTFRLEPETSSQAGPAPPDQPSSSPASPTL